MTSTNKFELSLLKLSAVVDKKSLKFADSVTWERR